MTTSLTFGPATPPTAVRELPVESTPPGHEKGLPVEVPPSATAGQLRRQIIRSDKGRDRDRLDSDCGAWIGVRAAGVCSSPEEVGVGCRVNLSDLDPGGEPTRDPHGAEEQKCGQ
jgi:hypothetical protein